MAAFKQHIIVSSVLGAGYALAMDKLGVQAPHAVLAGALCGVSGMLPDLDSDSGTPKRELFGLTAAVVPLLLLQRVRTTGLSPEGIVLLLGGLYLAIRFGASWLFKHFTVHRGMFHSLPAAAIAAEIVFLADSSVEPRGQVVLAGGVFLGFLSHLVLDELYSVDLHGFKVRLNRAAGSAVKVASQSVPATLMTWFILAVLSYFVGIKEGYFRPIHFSFDYPVQGSLRGEGASPRLGGQQPGAPEESEPAH